MMTAQYFGNLFRSFGPATEYGLSPYRIDWSQAGEASSCLQISIRGPSSYVLVGL